MLVSGGSLVILGWIVVVGVAGLLWCDALRLLLANQSFCRTPGVEVSVVVVVGVGCCCYFQAQC